MTFFSSTSWLFIGIADIAIGSGLGLAFYGLLAAIGVHIDPVLPVVIGAFLGLLWFSMFASPERSSGLQKGARYRVLTSFSSGNYEFREGEVIVFIRERKVISTDMYDQNPDVECDFYEFTNSETGEYKRVSSADSTRPDLWTRYLKLDPTTSGAAPEP